jgi:hypothetical protein
MLAWIHDRGQMGTESRSSETRILKITSAMIQGMYLLGPTMCKAIYRMWLGNAPLLKTFQSTWRNKI